MPRDNDKDNDSRGRRDRPPGGKGRSGRARGPEKKFAKKFVKGGLGDKNFDRKSERDRRPYPGKSEGARSFAKKPYSGSGNLTPQRERAPPRRDYDDTPHARDNRPGYNREDRAPRSDRGEARPASRFQDRKLGDRKPHTPRDGDKRPYAARGEGFRKNRIGRRVIGPTAVRAAIGPSESLAPTRSSRATAPRDRKSDPGNRSPRKDFGTDRGDAKPWQRRDDRGSHERPRFSRSREDRPKFDRPRRDREGDPGDRNSAPARPEGRNDWQEHPRARHGPRTGMPTGRAVTMKTTAGSSPNVRPSVAAPPIANVRRTSAVPRGRHAKRNPASASPRWWRVRGWPRAATPRDGSCRAASPSMAA